jgi:hypothetical protein
MAETRGLDLSVSIAHRQAPIDLPAFIPQIDGLAISRSILRPTVAIRLTDWLKRTRTVQGTGASMHDVLNIDPATQVLLLLYANDFVLEQKLWPARHEFADSLSVWRPDAVVVPDFSVWHRDSWLERQLSMVQSLRMFELLQDRGIVAIPHVAWGDEGQMAEWTRWLNGNRVEVLAMDLQCLQPALRGPFLSDLLAFRDALTCRPRLLVSGVTDEGWLRALLGVWPEASLTANVLIVGYKRRETIRRRSGKTTRTVIPGGDPSVLAMREVKRIEAIVESLMAFPWASKAYEPWISTERTSTVARLDSLANRGRRPVVSRTGRGRIQVARHPSMAGDTLSRTKAGG